MECPMRNRLLLRMSLFFDLYVNDDIRREESMAEKKKYSTIKDVAELAQTSTASVSSVLNPNSTRYISNELRERVLKAAKELNYYKSSVASSLKGMQMRTIALLLPQFQNPFFLRIAASIERWAYTHDFTIYICNSLDQPDREKKIIERALSQRVDGVIISPTSHGAENTQILRDLHIPYVVVDRPLVGVPSYSYATFDNFQLGALACQHLIDRGHRKLGFLEWTSPVESIQLRRFAVEQIARENRADLVVEYSAEIDRQAGYQAMERLMNKADGMTGLIFGQHMLAEGAYEYLRDRRLNIPEDISVVMLGTPDWALLHNPRFTCVKQPEQELGLAAADMLLEQIEKTAGGRTERKACFNCTLLPGESVKTL